MRVPLLFFLSDTLLLIGASLLVERNEAAAATVLVFTGAMMLWQIMLFSYVVSPMRMLRIETSIRKPHVIQAVLQLCLYLYWGLYWKEPARFATYIVLQIICAYMLDILLSLSRRRVWYAGLGPVPIVLSINLFIWFKEDFFYFQLLMVSVLTFFAKEFLTWNRDGRTRHIFNPSGFALAATAVLLLMSGTTDQYTIGVDLVESFELPPSFYEVIFLLGFVVQFLFATTSITLGAVLSHYLLFFAVSELLGGRAGAFPIDRSVFLAMTLLIPDPATSPRSPLGKFLFGATYGASILGVSIGLKYFQQPDYFSKILFIPFLNLLTPLFDRLAVPASTDETVKPRLSAWKVNLVTIALYSCLFAGILESLKETRREPLGRPWLKPVSVASQEMSELIVRMIISRELYPDAYQPFGFPGEIRHYPELKKIYEGDVTREQMQEFFRRAESDMSRLPAPAE